MQVREHTAPCVQTGAQIRYTASTTGPQHPAIPGPMLSAHDSSAGPMTVLRPPHSQRPQGPQTQGTAVFLPPATVWRPSYASACSPPEQAQASQHTGMQHAPHCGDANGPDRVQDTR